MSSAMDEKSPRISPTKESEFFSIDIERHASESHHSEAGSSSDSSMHGPKLRHIESHVSNADMTAVDPYSEQGDEIYSRFSSRKKYCMVMVLSFCGFLAPISSTTVLSAIPEVAQTYKTTGSIINISNALYLIFMGLSPVFWGPISVVHGRRWPLLCSSFLFLAFSIGTALAPDLVAFFIFRVLTAFQGTAFLIIGSSTIGDIYKPTERGTALGWFLSGTLVGPAFGPLLGGIIVTYRTFRDIFWLQAALAGTAFLLIACFLPETIKHKRSEELRDLPNRKKASKLWSWINPARVVLLYRYPNLRFTALASSSLVWNMYSFLTPIRYVLDPRFNLSTPLQAGLFYLVPGAGYMVGTFVGGRWADYTVKKWIRKRGQRVPEDRLRAALWFMGFVIPACMVIYGWCVEKRKGGIAVPIIAMFVQGVAQLFCFPALNVYCLDVIQKRSAEVVAGNFALRYFFGALGSAVVLPAIQKIGVGWFSTISAGFMVGATGLAYLTVLYGKDWREKIDAVNGL